MEGTPTTEEWNWKWCQATWTVTVNHPRGGAMTQPDGLYRVSTRYLCAGLVVEHGRVQVVRTDPAAAVGVPAHRGQAGAVMTRRVLITGSRTWTRPTHPPSGAAGAVGQRHQGAGVRGVPPWC
jgi:hypothetical protein